MFATIDCVAVNAKTPFSAVVTIGDVEYGRGYGHSKKVAKSEAGGLKAKLSRPKSMIEWNTAYISNWLYYFINLVNGRWRVRVCS